MSLINDALKRAQESEKASAPPQVEAPHFKPAEAAPASGARRGLVFAVPVAMGFLALLALLLVWWASRELHSAEPQTNVAARSVATEPIPATVPAAAPDEAPVASIEAPQAAPPADSTEPDVQKAANVATGNAMVDEPATNSLPVAVASAPPPLRLQAVIYDSTRPLIMLNGKTLGMGDQFGDWVVASIGRDSATLSGACETRVLRLGRK
jgi:hypothetical protein